MQNKGTRGILARPKTQDKQKVKIAPKGTVCIRRMLIDWLTNEGKMDIYKRDKTPYGIFTFAACKN